MVRKTVLMGGHGCQEGTWSACFSGTGGVWAGTVVLVAMKTARVIGAGEEDRVDLRVVWATEW